MLTFFVIALAKERLLSGGQPTLISALGLRPVLL
jgi:hypothetical protein